MLEMTGLHVGVGIAQRSRIWPVGSIADSVAAEARARATAASQAA
jgi:hypothetical protein